MGKRVAKKKGPDIEQTFWVLQSDTEMYDGHGEWDKYTNKDAAMQDAGDLMASYDAIYVVECKPVKKYIREAAFKEVDLD